MEKLRQCKYCGIAAYSEEDLELFASDAKSKYGRKNICVKCITRKVREKATGSPDKPLNKKRCTKCGAEFVGDVQIERNFTRFNPSFGNILGTLRRECNKCLNLPI